jgi:hypothetical protein
MNLIFLHYSTNIIIGDFSDWLENLWRGDRFRTDDLVLGNHKRKEAPAPLPMRKRPENDTAQTGFRNPPTPMAYPSCSPQSDTVAGGPRNWTREADATLWMLGRTDYIEVVERNLRQKVIAPDWRYATFDARLSLARLFTLQGRHDEAAEWFAKSCAVLEEQGARPPLAIADFDEAWMYLRRNCAGRQGRCSTRRDPM